MDIYSLLRQEHQRIRELFDRSQALAAGASERATQFRTLARELRAHLEAEESTFYTVLRALPEISERIEEALEEHVDIEELLQELAALDCDSAPFIAQLGELKEEIEHHFGQEEGEIFRRARTLLSADQEEQIARAMQAERSRLTA